MEESERTRPSSRTSDTRATETTRREYVNKVDGILFLLRKIGARGVGVPLSELPCYQFGEKGHFKIRCSNTAKKMTVGKIEAPGNEEDNDVVEGNSETVPGGGHQVNRASSKYFNKRNSGSYGIRLGSRRSNNVKIKKKN